MRAFVRPRQMLATHADLARKLHDLEKKYNTQLKVVFDAIRKLMIQPEINRRRIGFSSNRVETTRPRAPEQSARLNAYTNPRALYPARMRAAERKGIAPQVRNFMR